jgi:DNA/RNA endonuclease G (NUC1)
LWQGLKNYILNSARPHGFKACVFTARCTPTKAIEGFVLRPYRTFQIAIANLEAATGYASVR